MQSEDLSTAFPLCFMPLPVFTEHGGNYDRNWELGLGKGGDEGTPFPLPFLLSGNPDVFYGLEMTNSISDLKTEF